MSGSQISLEKRVSSPSSTWEEKSCTFKPSKLQPDGEERRALHVPRSDLAMLFEHGQLLCLQPWICSQYCVCIHLALYICILEVSLLYASVSPLLCLLGCLLRGAESLGPAKHPSTYSATSERACCAVDAARAMSVLVRHVQSTVEALGNLMASSFPPWQGFCVCASCICENIRAFWAGNPPRKTQHPLLDELGQK